MNVWFSKRERSHQYGLVTRESKWRSAPSPKRRSVPHPLHVRVSLVCVCVRASREDISFVIYLHQYTKLLPAVSLNQTNE